MVPSGDIHLNPGPVRGIDDDCDGGIDADVDRDHDGWTIADGDCDDDDGWTYPGAFASCDLRDNDCELEGDEGLEPLNPAKKAPMGGCSCASTMGGPVAPWALFLLTLWGMRRRVRMG